LKSFPFVFNVFGELPENLFSDADTSAHSARRDVDLYFPARTARRKYWPMALDGDCQMRRYCVTVERVCTTSLQTEANTLHGRLDARGPKDTRRQIRNERSAQNTK
jgi:hypothetical protein